MRVGCPLGTKMASMSRLTPDALVYETAAAGEPQVSHDGTRVVYTLGRADRDLDRPTAHIYLSAVDGSDLRQLTQVGDRNREARWSPDGPNSPSSRIGQEGHSGSACLPMRPGRSARADPATGRPSATWPGRPTAASIAYTTAFDPDNPDEEPPPKNRAPRVSVTRRLDYKQDNRGYLNDVRTQVFVVDVGVRRAAPADHASPTTCGTRSGRPTVDARCPCEHDNGIFSQLVLIDVADWPHQETYRARARQRRRLVVVAERRSHPLRRRHRARPRGSDFFVYDVAADTTDAPHDRPAVPARGWFSDDQSRPRSRSGSTTATVLFHAMRAGESWPLPLRRRHLRAARASTPRSSISVGFSVDRAAALHRPGALELRAAGRGRGLRPPVWRTRRVVTNLNADAAEGGARRAVGALRRRAQRRVTSRPGCSSRPTSTRSRTLSRSSSTSTAGRTASTATASTPSSRRWPATGFLVVFSNPRGSGSYGRDFAQTVRCDWGGEDYLDLMAVVDTALERPYVDRERTGIWGYSYGGYMTAWTIGQTDRFKAAVCGAPCFDLESMYGTSDISHAWGPYPVGRHAARSQRGVRRALAVDLRAPRDDADADHPGRSRRPLPDRPGRADVRRAQAGRLRGRVRALPRRRTRHAARRPALASRRLHPARAGLVHGPPRRACLRSRCSVADSRARRFEAFVDTSLDDALAGADDARRRPSNARSQLFHSVARDVPAYARSSPSTASIPTSIRSFDDFRAPAAGHQAQLPPAVPAARAVPRRSRSKPATWSPSPRARPASRRSGRASWPTSCAIARRFEQVFHDSFRADERRTLAVVCFALGTWVGGMYTASCCRHLAAHGYPITVVTPGNNEAEILRVVRELGAGLRAGRAARLSAVPEGRDRRGLAEGWTGRACTSSW